MFASRIPGPRSVYTKLAEEPDIIVLHVVAYDIGTQRHVPDRSILALYTTVPSTEQTLFHGLDLQSKMFRMEAAETEITHHAPETLQSNVSTHALDFTLVIQSPYWAALLSHFIAADIPNQFTTTSEASSKDDNVTSEFRSVFELETGLSERINITVRFKLDFALNQVLASPDV
jgi:hypothetical protein